MLCDCQRGEFNCEENVRRFLGVGRHNGLTDLAARDELMEKMAPLVERIVHSKLQGWRRQDRDDVVQETFLKLCDPAKLRTWLESPRRSWFCHWVAVVAARTVIDRFRSFGSPPPPSPPPPGPFDDGEFEGQAEQLRKCIIATLGEFELEWQLGFAMRWSYLEPCISDIARAAKVSEETVYYRHRKIKERIANRCSPLLSSEVAEVELPGTRHPVKGYERLERSKQDEVNDAIRTMVAARPIREQFAFYIKYSPLAASVDELAAQLQEDKETVHGWLADIETQIKRICPADGC